MKKLIPLLYLSLMALCGVTQAGSSTINSVQDLADITDTIIEGRIIRIDTAIDPNSFAGISTYITLSNVYAYHGDVKDSEVVVKLPGGEYMGVTSSVGGNKLDIDEDDTMLFFLQENKGQFSVVSRGIFRVGDEADKGSLYDLEGVEVSEQIHDQSVISSSFPSTYSQMVNTLPELSFPSEGKTLISTAIPKTESLRRYGKLRDKQTDEDWDREFFSASDIEFDEIVHRIAQWQGVGVNEAASIMRDYEDQINALKKVAISNLDALVSENYTKDRVKALSNRVSAIGAVQSKSVEPPQAESFDFMEGANL